MTFLDTDLARVLEEVLPEHFGGGPTDYQLAEEESDGGGGPCIRSFLIHPRVGPVDAVAASRVFLDAIGSGSGAEKVMQLAWREARFLSVERRPPRLTPLGKVLHLHTDRAAAAPPA